MGNPTIIKALLVLLAILIGVVAGLVAGFLARAVGESVTAAIRSSAIAFGGTVTLAILIMTSLDLL